MKKVLSIVLIMVIVLSMSFTSFAASTTRTATTSGGTGGVITATFTLLCKRNYSASTDGYVLTCSAPSGLTAYFNHKAIMSTTKAGNVSTSTGAETSGLVNTKVWQNSTGMAGNMYSSSTQAKAYNDGVFGSTIYVELAALYG